MDLCSLWSDRLYVIKSKWFMWYEMTRHRHSFQYSVECVCCDGVWGWLWMSSCWVVTAPLDTQCSMDSIGSPHCICYPLNGNFGVVPITPFFLFGFLYVIWSWIQIKGKKKMLGLYGVAVYLSVLWPLWFLFFVLVWLSVPGNVPVLCLFQFVYCL